MTENALIRLTDWIGRSETREEVVEAARAQGLAAALGCADAGSGIGSDAYAQGQALPPVWHWLYFWPLAARAAIGHDGHPKLGGFLPPIALPRRMWAGSRIDFFAPLKIGQSVRRTSTIADVQPKQGRSGTLVFLKLRHEYHSDEQRLLVDEQDIVYREAAPAGAPASAPTPAPALAPADPAWCQEIVPDEALLFRYSALTFNAHRIHYDYPYATQQEGYSGLVVHGPLIATLLLEHLRARLAQSAPGKRIVHFAFRALSPLVHTDRFAVCAEPAEQLGEFHLWARRSDGALCMQATARIA